VYVYRIMYIVFLYTLKKERYTTSKKYFKINIHTVYINPDTS